MIFILFFSGTSIKSKESNSAKDKVTSRPKKKEESSESELEEGELAKKETDIITEKHEDIDEPEEVSEENKAESETTCDNKDTAKEEVTSSENAKEESEVPAKLDSETIKNNLEDKENNTITNNLDTETTNTEEKENKLPASKNGEIKLVEQAKLINDVIEIEEADDYLMYLEDILGKIHKFFYEINDGKREGERDMKRVIPAVRCEVLAGTKLVFSGLVPTNQSLEQSRAFNIARGLGAEVSQDLTKDCTHLVAVRTGTAKVTTPSSCFCCSYGVL